MSDSDNSRAVPSVLSRRSLLWGGALASVAGGLGLAGCSRDDASSPLSLAHASAGGETELKVAFDGAGVTNFALDPHNSGYAPHNRVMRSLFDSLTCLLPDQSVGPWLAESWEISPERTEYVFKLRTDVKFHDGTVFDAAALKANFDRLNDPKNALTSRASLGPYLSSEVLAADRLRVLLSAPHTPFLRVLSMTKLAIVSPSAVAKYGRAFAQHPVASGPFRFVGMEAGRSILLERNPDYQWAAASAAHKGPARVDKLSFINVPEESTRVAVLLSGQVHAADLVPAQNLTELRADPKFALHEKELLNTNYALSLNVSRQPWDDVDMRLAFRLSLDIDTIVRVVYRGNFKRAWSVLSPSMIGSAEAALANSWKPDLERARALLTQKGWLPAPDGIRVKNGKRLLIRFIDSQGNREKRLDVVQMVRRQLQATGIGLVVDSQPPGVSSAAMVDNQYDLAGGASFHSDPDILRQTYLPEIRSALSGNRVDDAEISTWLKAAAREPEGPARVAYYEKVQRKILDQTYAVPIYVLPYNIAVVKAVSGVTLDAHGFPELHDAHFVAAQT